MSIEILALVLSISAVALVVFVVIVLRRSDKSKTQDLERDLDQAVTELQRERELSHAQANDLARLNERVTTIGRLENELSEAKAEMRLEQTAVGRLKTEIAALTTEASQYRARNQKAEQKIEELRVELEGVHRAQAEAAAHLIHSERAREDMKDFLANAQNRLSDVFATLAGKTFDERTQNAAKKSKEDLEGLLKPFADQLNGFRSRVDTLYGEEAKERAALLGAVNELKTLNQDMAGRTHELTRALKGSSKVRGDWGELMLESVLQGSGLVEGTHYDRQKSEADDEGQRLQPDVVVRLPDDRRIVVDSKVNLLAWQEAMNADNPDLHQDALRRHAVALRQHVKDLGEKNYPKAIGDSALEVTIAFVPIEGALSAALGADGALQTYAFDRKIVFASPNTLMALLRVVDRLWTRDKIQREAAEIGKVGGHVLDSLMNFLADFDNVGQQLEDARTAFNAARGKLSESRYAVIPRARRLAELGAKGKKSLADELKSDPESPPVIGTQRMLGIKDDAAIADD